MLWGIPDSNPLVLVHIYTTQILAFFVFRTLVAHHSWTLMAHLDILVMARISNAILHTADHLLQICDWRTKPPLFSGANTKYAANIGIKWNKALSDYSWWSSSCQKFPWKLVLFGWILPTSKSHPFPGEVFIGPRFDSSSHQGHPSRKWQEFMDVFLPLVV